MAIICFIIHGIGRQDQQFADRLERGVEAKLAQILESGEYKGPQLDPEAVRRDIYFRPLYWANIGSAEQTDLYRRIYPGLHRKTGFLASLPNTWKELGFIRKVSIDLIGDVFAYLGRFEEPIKREVYKQMSSTLREKADEPISIIFAAHSLGGVIVQDLVGGLVKYGCAGAKSLISRTSIVTFGSPVAFFSLVDRSDLASCERWINLRHGWDPIAFPVSPVAQIDNAEPDQRIRDERISLWRFWYRWPSLWRGLKNPHSSYWEHPYVHETIAAELVRHYTSDLRAKYADVPPLEPPLEVFASGNRVTAESGLTEFCADFHKFQFGPYIEAANEIDVMVVYGRTWIGQNVASITKVLCRPGAKVRVCITDPASPAIPALCRLFGEKPRKELVGKIVDATNTWISAFNEAKKRNPAEHGRLVIYYLMNPPNHGYYRMDDTSYITLRPTTGSQAAATPMPMMMFRKTDAGGVYRWLANDFEVTLAEVGERRVVFDSASSENNQ